MSGSNCVVKPTGDLFMSHTVSQFQDLPEELQEESRTSPSKDGGCNECLIMFLLDRSLC